MSASVGPDVVDTNLVLSLDAGNYKSYPGSGSIWYDLSPRKNHATIEAGTPSFGITGDYTGGSFNTSSGSFITDNVYGSGLSNFTVEAWFKPTGYLNQRESVVADYYPNYVNFKIGFEDSTTMNGGIYNGGGWYYSTASFVPALNTWHHCCVTWDGSNITLYKNGEYLNTNALALGTAQSSDVGIRIGRRWDYAEYFQGYISIVRIYSVAYDRNIVLKNFNAVRSRFNL